MNKKIAPAPKILIQQGERDPHTPTAQWLDRIEQSIVSDLEAGGCGRGCGSAECIHTLEGRMPDKGAADE